MKHTSSLIRLPAVMQMSGLSRATIYRLESAGAFPPRVRISERAVGWRLDQVEQWMQQRVPARTRA